MLAWGGVPRSREAKRLPHVHDHQPDAGRFPRAEPRVELVQARLRAIRAPKPDRALPNQVTDDDAVGVALLDRDLVEPDDPRRGRPGPPQLLAHVLLLERLHRVPVQPELLGHIPDRGGPTAPSHVEGKAFGVEGIGRQKGGPLLLRRATAPAPHAPNLAVEVDAQVAAGGIPDAPSRAVVPPALPLPAGPTGRFFDRRVRVKDAGVGIAEDPGDGRVGSEPGKAIRIPPAAAVVVELACADHARFSRCLPSVSVRAQSGFSHRQPPVFTHSLPRRANKRRRLKPGARAEQSKQGTKAPQRGRQADGASLYLSICKPWCQTVEKASVTPNLG